MTASRVTPPTDEEGANVERAEEAGGAAIYVCGHFSRSWASLRFTVAISMVHMIEK